MTDSSPLSERYSVDALNSDSHKLERLISEVLRSKIPMNAWALRLDEWLEASAPGLSVALKFNEPDRLHPKGAIGFIFSLIPSMDRVDELEALAEKMRLAQSVDSIDLGFKSSSKARTFIRAKEKTWELFYLNSDGTAQGVGETTPNETVLNAILRFSR